VNTRFGWVRQNEERQQYWQTVPLRAYAWVVLSASLIFFSVGFASDPTLQWPFWWVVGKAAFLGFVIGLGSTATIRNNKARFVFAPVFLVLLVVLQKIQPDLPLNKTLVGPEFTDIQWRLRMDAGLSGSAAVLGYFVFVIFMGTQGVRHVRVRTELELAERLQQTLAPE
jgi:hypothetical protein